MIKIQSMRILYLLCLFVFVSFQGVSQETTYRNPVIPGDFPDPSVIRVAGAYYMASSSSEWGPPYRFYRSKDLINWENLGSIFRDKPQWTMGSYWAPELFYRNGTFYVYYTARRASDRKSFIGVATTKDPEQGFTDHGLLIEWTNEAIDAYVIEWNGKLYITWKAYGLDQGRLIEILGSELSDDGLKLQGKEFSLLKADPDNWEAGGIEGQCIVEQNGYLYMFYAGNACCGRNCNYQTGVARAKSINGPWEKYSGNPILVGDDHWRCPGHGTLVETPDRRYFYLYHAYNANTHVFTGREGMMDEIIWNPTTGWPSFRYGKTPSLQALTPYPGTFQEIKTRFTAPAIPWIWDISAPRPDFRISGETLVIENKTDTKTFLGFRTAGGNYRLKARVEPGSTSSGICLYGSANHCTGLSLHGKQIELWQITDGNYTVLASETVGTTEAISICANTQCGQYYQLGYLSPEGQFHKIGNNLDINGLVNWDRPPMIGIHVNGKGTSTFREVEIIYGQ